MLRRKMKNICFSTSFCWSLQVQINKYVVMGKKNKVEYSHWKWQLSELQNLTLIEILINIIALN